MNRRTRAAIKWGALGAIVALLLGLLVLNLMPPHKQQTRALGRISAVGTAQFRRDLDHIADPPAVDGNTIEDLQNGDSFFPAMLAAIHGARRSVVLESYIYVSDAISTRFDDALIERARAGIPVYLLVDWVGSHKKSDQSIRRLKAAGVHFAYFHPLHWYDPDRLNDRTHRKLLVVDGSTGFIGGADIRQGWMSDGTGQDKWRDMQFRVTGPVVADLLAVFEDNWLSATGASLIGPDYYPPLPDTGTVAIQAIASSPMGHRDAIRRSYLLAIDGARERIDMEAAYFVPDTHVHDALLRAIRRGVKVRILLPGTTDTRIVLDASREQWGDFLEAGARLYRFQPAMLHSKLMVVDDRLTLAGSSNFDSRSFDLNDEANFVAHDPAFGRHMRQVIDGDIAHAQPVTLEQWRDRPWWQKLEDWSASLVAWQL